MLIDGFLEFPREFSRNGNGTRRLHDRKDIVTAGINQNAVLGIDLHQSGEISQLLAELAMLLLLPE